MTGDTKQLIRRLTEDTTPVHRLRGPWVRAAMWLAVSMAYILVFLSLMPTHEPSHARDSVFLIEQIAAFLTGLTAAIGAFASVVPGYDRKWIGLPLLPLAVWLASLGPGCVQELSQFGIAHTPLTHNPWCVPVIVLFGALPAAAITIMLGRGAPLTPRLTAALGALAASGLANVGVRVVHPEDVSIMLLFWHIGAVLVISTIAGATGRYFFNWSTLIQKSKVRT
jgi:hypothetical protein